MAQRRNIDDDSDSHHDSHHSEYHHSDSTSSAAHGTAGFQSGGSPFATWERFGQLQMVSLETIFGYENRANIQLDCRRDERQTGSPWRRSERNESGDERHW